LDMRLGGFQSRSGRGGEDKNSQKVYLNYFTIRITIAKYSFLS